MVQLKSSQEIQKMIHHLEMKDINKLYQQDHWDKQIAKKKEEINKIEELS
jgi:hypothetical protein